MSDILRKNNTEISSNRNIPHCTWFEQARFGMFIHWGLYSIAGRGEWMMNYENIPAKEYNKYATQFNPPEDFTPESWVLLAKRAGMKYAVLTTRHHDGFALFHSQLSQFNSVQTASKRDFVGEFVQACRKHNLRVGLYYSIMNWQYPACYEGPLRDPSGWADMVENTHGQLRELMTNYGRIDLLWYDGCVTPGIGDDLVHQKYWRTPDLNAMVRELQPDILINDRAALPEDFCTPEQHFSPPEPGRRCEACMTINNNWGYNKNDDNFKSVGELKETLIRCACFNSNLLLNIGPMADGTVQPEVVQRLEELGNWLDIAGDGIYGTRRSPFSETEHLTGKVTIKGNTAYLFLSEFNCDEAVISGVTSKDVITETINGTQLPSNILDGICTIRGFAPDKEQILKLTLPDSEEFAEPAKILGGSAMLVEHESGAPVLGANPNRFAIDDAAVYPAELLAGSIMPGCVKTITDAEDWVPGWTGAKVLALTQGRLSLRVCVEATGCYDIDIGLVSRDATAFGLWIDGVENYSCPMRYAGYPDTITIKALPLKRGNRVLTLRSTADFGLYALRLNPVWIPLPSEVWDVIGPFPTSYNVHAPMSEVRKAMHAIYPPELEFNPGYGYRGTASGTIHWQSTNKQEGTHSECGVNFPFRCGFEAGGVCYARTVIESDDDIDVQAALGCDWWCNVYVNGHQVITGREAEEDGSSFCGWKPRSMCLNLKKGENELLVKSHPGSTMHWFTFYLNNPGFLKILGALRHAYSQPV